MGSAGGSSLDDLMLAYTDLSLPAKGLGQGFKGPPVKDIKREAPSQVFQHSNKARDWKTLDQSLESAFGAAAPVQPSGPTPMVFTPQPQLLGVGQSSEVDEWGDFQDFKVNSFPSSLLGPAPPPPHTSQTVGCRLASFQDESPVHRFKTVQPTTVPPPHNIPVKIPNFPTPAQVMPTKLAAPQANYITKSQPSSILDLDDEFGDFAVPSTISFTSLTSSNISLSSSKSFSSTFPIDQPIQSLSKHQNTFPIDRPITLSNTFPIDRVVSTSKTFSIDQPIPPPVHISSPIAPLTMPSSIAPIPVPLVTAHKALFISGAAMVSNTTSLSSDKYSALRGFLEQPEETFDQLSVSNDSVNTSSDPLNPSGQDDLLQGQSSNSFNLQQCQTLPKAGETDFGDFVEVSAPSVNIGFPPLQGFSSQPHWPQSTSTSLFDSFSTATPSFPPQVASNRFPAQLVPPQPMSTILDNNQPASFPLQFTSPQPQPINFPTLLPSPTNQNESHNLDEWSLPTSQLSDYKKPVIDTYKPAKPTTIPFLCSSPPPSDSSVPSILSSSPPLMSSPSSQLNVEEFSLPSEQFGFSDQEIFGIRKVKKETNQPKSIQDILSSSKKNHSTSESPKQCKEIVEEVKAVEEASLENSRQGSPSSLRVPSKSPESQSVASLEFDNHTNDATKQLDDKKPELEREDSKEIFTSPHFARCNGVTIEESNTSSSPYAEWTLLLTEILTMMESTRDTFDNIISEDLKEEVITSEQGKTFLINLKEVHQIYKRVAKSYKLMVNKNDEKVEVVGQICDEIDRDWQRLEEHCESYGALGKPEDVASGLVGVCGVCLGGGGDLVYGGTVYHPGCANYWVNCVRDTLPCLGRDSQ